MADNISVTQGAGTTVRTKDKSGTHTQVIGIALGETAPTEVILGAGSSTQVMADSLPVSIASDNYVKIVEKVYVDTEHPTLTSASAYTVGMSVGGLLEVSSAVRVTSGSAIWQSITVVDEGSEVPNLIFTLFDAQPGTSWADRATPAYAAEVAKIVAQALVTNMDYNVTGGVAVASVSLALPVTASGSTSLWLCVTTNSTPAWSAGQDLYFKLGFIQE